MTYPRQSEIEDTQARMIRQYHLTRQMALLMALLVCTPHVTHQALHVRFGGIDHKNLVSRLRWRLRQIDDQVLVHNAHGFGYYLTDDVRTRLHLDVPRPVHAHAKVSP